MQKSLVVTVELLYSLVLLVSLHGDLSTLIYLFYSVKRFSKPTRFDKRFQVFGPKPETHGV